MSWTKQSVWGFLMATPHATRAYTALHTQHLYVALGADISEAVDGGYLAVCGKDAKW